jgi:hypothetical protein
VGARDLPELGVVADVVVLLVDRGREHEAHAPGGEVVELPPDHVRHEQPVVGAVQEEALLVLAVVDAHVEGAGGGDDERLQVAVRVPAARGPARHVVEVVDPRDVERDVVVALDERQVAARVGHARQVDDPAAGRPDPGVDAGVLQAPAPRVGRAALDVGEVRLDGDERGHAPVVGRRGRGLRHPERRAGQTRYWRVSTARRRLRHRPATKKPPPAHEVPEAVGPTKLGEQCPPAL